MESNLKIPDQLLSEATEILKEVKVSDGEYVNVRLVRKACKKAWQAVSLAINVHLNILPVDYKTAWISWADYKTRFEKLDKELLAIVCQGYFYLYINSFPHKVTS